jgi:hypothetical protein
MAVWVVSRPRRRRLEFGLSENYSGRGVRRDALLTASGKSGWLACEKRVRRDALLTAADEPAVRLPFYPSMSRLSDDRVGSRRLRAVTLPHHRTCGFPHPAVEPGSGLAHCVLPWYALRPWSFHSALLHFVSPGAGSLPVARFLQADPLLYSPRADLSRKCALRSLLDCFGKLLAPLFQSSSSWSVSWFFGPSLLPAFTGFLHYYGLC